jgi:hypothetical protein
MESEELDFMEVLLKELENKYQQLTTKYSVCFRETGGNLVSTGMKICLKDICPEVLNGYLSSGTCNKGLVILFGFVNPYERTHPHAHCKLFIAVPSERNWALNELHTALKKQREAHSSRSTTTTTATTAITVIAATITTIAVIAKTFFYKQ